jgi:mannose-6-phosphate isomerase
MTVEYAPVRAVHKPWGSTDLRPWRALRDSNPVGELWFERPGSPTSDLLLKLIFTRENLSIQVHPTDAYARSIGLAHGKSEAWVILDAAPGARIALGLRHRVTSEQLRAALQDGSILDLVQWRAVAKGDVVMVPAGTIHAIGAGLIIAEIQQNIDATFRLYDYGRTRRLHLENGMAVADPGPAQDMAAPRMIDGVRTLLAADPHFVLERIALPAGSGWDFAADIEVWLLVTEGRAHLGRMPLSPGEAIFLRADRTMIRADAGGTKAIVAYSAAAPLPDLLSEIAGVAQP